MTDIFLGEEILGYSVEEYKGGGAIGKIYRAYNPSLEDSRAIKFIPVGEETLRDGWENEIIKVNKLKYQDNVVKYHTHKTVEIKSEKYLYIKSLSRYHVLFIVSNRSEDLCKKNSGIKI